MNVLRGALAAVATAAAALFIAAPAHAANAQQPSSGSETVTSPVKGRAGCKPGPRYQGKDTELCFEKKQVSPRVIKKKFAEALTKPRIATRAAESVDPPRSCPVTEASSVQHVSRLYECSAITYKALLRDKKTQEIVGSQQIYDWQHIDFQWNATQWSHEAIIAADPGTGALVGGIYVNVRSSCSLGIVPNCRTLSADPPEFEIYHLTGSSGILDLTWQEGVIQDPLPGYQFAIPLKYNLGIGVGWTSGLTTDQGEVVLDDGSTNGIEPVLDGRCDNADSAPSEDNPEGSNNRGCVDQLFTPTLTYDATRNPAVQEVAKHIYDRQAGDPTNSPVVDGTPLPTGAPLPSRWGMMNADGTGNPLHRTQDEAKIDANRAKACPDLRPVSCDEWPLASTREGAAFTSVGPQDWSWRTVPLAANNSQGGLTGTFYNQNRIIDGDPFWVRAVLNDGRQSW